MNDQGFLDQIADGEQFAMGDRIEAEIEIIQEFDKSIQAYKIKSRKVLRVLDHIPRPKQQKLPK